MDSHISLPQDLQVKIEREADARGMSISDFVRVSLENAIDQMPEISRKSVADDPLLGMMSDDASLVDQVVADAFAARETHPLRAND